MYILALKIQKVHCVCATVFWKTENITKICESALFLCLYIQCTVTDFVHSARLYSNTDRSVFLSH